MNRAYMHFLISLGALSKTIQSLLCLKSKFIFFEMIVNLFAIPLEHNLIYAIFLLLKAIIFICRGFVSRLGLALSSILYSGVVIIHSRNIF